MSTLICSKISALKPFCPKSNYRKTYYVSSGSKQRASAITQPHAKPSAAHVSRDAKRLTNERQAPQQPDKDSAFCHRPTFKHKTQVTHCTVSKKIHLSTPHLVHKIYQSAYTLQHCIFQISNIPGYMAAHTIPKTVPTQDSKCVLAEGNIKILRGIIISS